MPIKDVGILRRFIKLVLIFQKMRFLKICSTIAFKEKSKELGFFFSDLVHHAGQK